MITEDYVSFEVAKLLKEKWFDGDTASCYILEDSTHHIMSDKVVQSEYYESQDSNEHGHLIQAPTLQMAMKWLREVHYIFIYITPSLRYWGSDHKYDKEHPWFLEGYRPHVFHGDNPHEFRVIDKYYVPTYEKACEAAIKYCLENLI